MKTGGLDFARANLGKLLSLPLFALSWLVALVVPRSRKRWVFGSGIGIGEGALAVARVLRRHDPAASIVWMVDNETQAEEAIAEGFLAAHKTSLTGYWHTLRAAQIVVTHGLGDANRYATFGARITHLVHGAPLKKLHLDSPVTTAVSGPAPVRALLLRMYRSASQRIELYVAGSVTAAERLRTAYRVAPGKVRVLGDPRDDILCVQATVPAEAASARSAVRDLLGLPAGDEKSAAEPLFLYAPTWRDGDADPAIPTAEEIALIHQRMETLGAHLVLRSHPLGAGAYEAALGTRVHVLGADRAREITPLLGAFDVVVTDYSSIAVDFSLFGRPIVWFAPDLEAYSATRGLYEPLMVTAAGRVQRDWRQTLDRLSEVTVHGPARTVAQGDARALAQRFHAYRDGGSAARVLAEIMRLGRPARERIEAGAVYFESFYGRQVSCNPLAIDREIAARFPKLPRYWSVASERIAPPPGATPVLVGGPDWHAARRYASLLVVNDWLRFGFRARRGQTVLQTWHGTMLKHLALGRPGVALRTRVAIHRESRRWDLLLSQNPHSTTQFRSSYAFRGDVLEVGYPRDDRLARAHAGEWRSPIVTEVARRALGIEPDRRVLAYVPTWRDAIHGPVDLLGVQQLAAELGDEWVVVARGHTRSQGAGGYRDADSRVVDASRHPDVNDVLLAADVLVTDYSSVMFDAAVAHVPTLFFVPDLVDYRDRERGFTFDFESRAPGPLLSTPEEVRACVQEFARHGQDAAWVQESRARAKEFRARFAPWDDGDAAMRVVDELVRRGSLPRA